MVLFERLPKRALTFVPVHSRAGKTRNHTLVGLLQTIANKPLISFREL